LGKKRRLLPAADGKEVEILRRMKRKTVLPRHTQGPPDIILAGNYNSLLAVARLAATLGLGNYTGTRDGRDVLEIRGASPLELQEIENVAIQIGLHIIKNSLKEDENDRRKVAT